MAASANITQAIDEVVANIVSKRTTLRTSFLLWLNVFGETLPTSGPPFSPLEERSLGNRSVRNWQPISRVLLERIPVDPTAGRLDTERVIDIVFRTANAVKFAEIAGDITTAQRDAILAQYNLAWT